MQNNRDVLVQELESKYGRVLCWIACAKHDSYETTYPANPFLRICLLFPV